MGAIFWFTGRSIRPAEGLAERDYCGRLLFQSIHFNAHNAGDYTLCSLPLICLFSDFNSLDREIFLF